VVARSPPGSPREGRAFAAKKAGKKPGQASYYSPLAQRVSEENAERREQAKTYQRRTAGYPSEFEMVTDTPLEDLMRIGLWHVLEPVENGVVRADAYVRGIHELFESERAEMADIYSADEEVLVGIWQLFMERITEERQEVPEILRAYCDEWRARLEGNDPQGRVHEVIARGELRKVVSYWWRYNVLLLELEKARMVEAIVQEVEDSGPPTTEEYAEWIRTAQSEMSPQAFARYVGRERKAPQQEEEEAGRDEDSMASNNSLKAKLQKAGKAVSAKGARSSVERTKKESAGGMGHEIVRSSAPFFKFSAELLKDPDLVRHLKEELDTKSKAWLDSITGTMSTARLPLIRAIRPYLFLENTKSIDKKPERIDYVGPKRDVFDAERAYRALDDFMKTNHWSAW
jgi:hypothetical protein